MQTSACAAGSSWMSMPVKKHGVVEVVLAVAVEVGDGGHVGGVRLVEAVVAVLVEARERAC